MTVTRRPKRRGREQFRKSTKCTFLFDCVDDVLDAKLALAPKSEIVRLGSRYLLTAEPVGDIELNILREYGKEIDN